MRQSKALYWWLLYGSGSGSAPAPLPDTFTRGWITDSNYTFSDNLVTPIVHLGQVDRIREYRNTSTNNDLAWIGSDPTGGKGQHTEIDAYGSGQKPVFINRHGGLIFIANTFDRHFETVSLTSAISGACTSIRFFIPLGGTLNEYWCNSSNILGMIRDRSNARLSGGKTNTEVDPNAGGIPDMYKVHMVADYRDGSGNMTRWIDGVQYNSGNTIAIGTNNIAEQAFGATGHPADTLTGPVFYISGSQTPGDAAWLAMIAEYKAWFESYAGLTLGSYPTAFPLVTLDGGGLDDTPVWNNSINRWTVPASASLRNGADTYICTWWKGGTTNGIQYENRDWIKTIESQNLADLWLDRTELGGAAESTTNQWICFELYGKNSSTGEVTPFDIKSKFKIDNIT